MAKKSSIEKNKRRVKMSIKDLTRRLALKGLIMNKKTKVIKNEKKWCKVTYKKPLRNDWQTKRLS